MNTKVWFSASVSKLIVHGFECHNFINDDFALLTFMNGDIEVMHYDKHLGFLIGNVNQGHIVNDIIKDFQSSVNMVKMNFKTISVDILI